MMMSELFNDWDRADEILKLASPFEAMRLGKIIGVRQINGCTEDMSTVRHAYNTDDLWLSAPGMIARAMSARFYGNEELTKKLLAMFPRQLAKTSQYDVHWGIGLTQTEATLSMDWFGTNWIDQALTEPRNHLLQTQIASSRIAISDAKSIIPTDYEVVNSELWAVATVINCGLVTYIWLRNCLCPNPTSSTLRSLEKVSWVAFYRLIRWERHWQF